MDNALAAHPKLPAFYLTFDVVTASGLLSPERLAAVQAEIDKRLTIPLDPVSLLPIQNARLADLTPYGRYLYPASPGNDDPWYYARMQLLCAVLTDGERKLLSDHAHSAASARKDAERFAKARHIPAGEWTGWVTDGDRYWDSIGTYLDEKGDVMDALIEDGTMADMVHQPRYLWAARPETVIHSVDVNDVFECQMCDRGWEEMDAYDLNGVPELQAALDAFVKANESVVAYQLDYSTAIILSA